MLIHQGENPGKCRHEEMYFLMEPMNRLFDRLASFIRFCSTYARIDFARIRIEAKIV